MILYTSTSCLKQKLSIWDMLNLFKECNIKNIELGVRQKYIKINTKLLKNSNFNFTVHHYFPPPKKPFIVNLASQDKKILEKSINQIKKSIDFCNNLNISLFSFHAGFRIDPDMSFKFNFSDIPDYEKSFNIFKDSVLKIVKYAGEKNVTIAIENNIISEYNLVHGKNEILLMCELWEFKRLFKEIPSKNFGILLDLGHLKVSSSCLNFDSYNFIDELKNKVFAIHVHENNGRIDEHRELKKDSWCFKVINRYFGNKDIPMVIESKYPNIEDLIRNKLLIEKLID